MCLAFSLDVEALGTATGTHESPCPLSSIGFDELPIYSVLFFSFPVPEVVLGMQILACS